jgi:hypothetical protein
MSQTFSTDEYAEMAFILGVCDGNATAASAEYHRRYPNHRIPIPKTIQRTFNTLRETGSLPSVRIHRERDPERQSIEEENILGGHLTRTDCILITSKKYNICNLGILPVAWISATG